MYPNDDESLLRVLNAPRRNHFFYGKRMDVQHFEMEQSYGKLKQWLLNRLTLGKGVLCGLRVSIEGDRVCVDPGFAIDGLGREIIVPVRACIDPLADDDGCCSHHRPEPTPPPERGDASTGDDAAGRRRPSDGIFTLWVCYRECLADYEPALVSDCETRSHCAAGTLVETFCLKVTQGLPPLQDDPQWCAKLWGHPPSQPTSSTPDRDGNWVTHEPSAADAAALGLTSADLTSIRDALQSKRHLLCELFDGTCDPPSTDPCVPLAVILLRSGRLHVESCLVRPRIYSNARLLDLILCLADKIDECCNHQEPPPATTMRVRSIDFLNRNADGVETLVGSVQTPLQDTQLDIARNVNSIRVRFSKPIAQNQHKPTTHDSQDPDFKSHNVQVLPHDPLGNNPFVPGSLTVEAADTIRFDLLPERPYWRPEGGWQKGRYQLFLRGTENLSQNQQALADSTDKAFDGEATAPIDGVMSGDGTHGGDFTTYFVIGGGEPESQPTLRVRSVEFVMRPPGAQERIIGRVQGPQAPVLVRGQLDAIRIRFNTAFSQDVQRKPTVASMNDPDFKQHNVQVRLTGAEARSLGVQFVPGSLMIESPETLRFDVQRGTRVVNEDGVWRLDVTNCALFLRGTAASGVRPPIADAAGNALDGELTAPANGVISGDGTAGGDFVADFTVRTAG